MLAITCRNILLLFFLTMHTHSFTHSHEEYLVNGLHEIIKAAQNDFRITYSFLIEKNHFPEQQKNSLFTTINLKNFEPSDGIALLQLLNWLNTQTDSDSLFLLEKLNTWSFLEINRFITKIDLSSELIAELGSYCHIFYYKKTDTYQFHSLLTKTLVQIKIINESGLGWGKRKESALWCLEKLKYEFLEVNEKMNEYKLDQKIIFRFFELLTIYSCNPPFVKPNSIKNIIITSVISILIIYIIYKIIKDKALIKNKLEEWAHNFRDWVIKPIGQGFAESIINEIIHPQNESLRADRIARLHETINSLKPDVNILFTDMGDNIRNGFMGNQEQIAQFSQEVARNAIHGITTNADETPNNDLEIIGATLGKNISSGAKQDIKENIPLIGRFFKK